MSIGRDRPRHSQGMPALSRARWPYTNTRCIVASDVNNYSVTTFESAVLIGGEEVWVVINATNPNINWAVHPLYSFCHVEGHGHLDTVHGLGHVDKQRNDVCTTCYGSSKFSYEHWELWPRSLYCSCRQCIHRRSVLRARGETWCDCMKSMSVMRTCAEP